MDDNFSVTAPDELLCNSCFVKVTESDAFCGNCGYPVKGTEKEQQAFIANKTIIEIDSQEYRKKIKNAGYALYWVAGGTVLSALLLLFKNLDDESNIGLAIVNLVLATVFIFLAAWSSKKPLAAILCGTALYVIILLLNMIQSPELMFRGIIVKIVIIGALIKGIISAVAGEKLKKEFNLR